MPDQGGSIILAHTILEHSMYEILQILSITILQKMPILKVFSDCNDSAKNMCPDNQLKLFDF